MPNWASVQYTITGNKKELKEFADAIIELENLPESRVENGFGNLWLGNFVDKYGGDWHKVECRGWIYGYEINEDSIHLYTECAWRELTGWRDFIGEKFPSFDIYFRCEEPGMACYYTNDDYGMFYPGKYYLDNSFFEKLDDEEGGYFDTFDDLRKFIKERIGLDVKSFEECNHILDEYFKTLDDDDAYFKIHEVEIVD